MHLKKSAVFFIVVNALSLDSLVSKHATETRETNNFLKELLVDRTCRISISAWSVHISR